MVHSRAILLMVLAASLVLSNQPAQASAHSGKAPISLANRFVARIAICLRRAIQRPRELTRRRWERASSQRLPARLAPKLRTLLDTLQTRLPPPPVLIRC